MTAGLNMRFDIYRIDWDADDIVGGAMVTGTCVYENVMGRFQTRPRQQLLLQQGLETERTFSAVIIPGTLDIRERDEVTVVEPYDSVYHNTRFRIVGVSYSDHNPRDPRNYIMLDLVRSVEAHGNIQ